jgi:hypothetical protein
MAVFWVVAPCSLIEAEMSVNFYQTSRRNNPKESHLHTRRRENLRSNTHLSRMPLCLHSLRLAQQDTAEVCAVTCASCSTAIKPWLLAVLLRT